MELGSTTLSEIAGFTDANITSCCDGTDEEQMSGRVRTQNNARIIVSVWVRLVLKTT